MVLLIVLPMLLRLVSPRNKPRSLFRHIDQSPFIHSVCSTLDGSHFFLNADWTVLNFLAALKSSQFYDGRIKRLLWILSCLQSSHDSVDCLTIFRSCVFISKKKRSSAFLSLIFFWLEWTVKLLRLLNGLLSLSLVCTNSNLNIDGNAHPSRWRKALKKLQFTNAWDKSRTKVTETRSNNPKYRATQ